MPTTASYVLRHVQTLLFGCLLTACAPRDEQARYAPATGRIGGAGLGAGIGSISGHAGSGAVLGLLFGGLGGDLIQSQATEHRLIDPVGTAKAASATVREGSSARATLQGERDILAGRIATAKAGGDDRRLLIARAEAARHREECRMWERRMEDTGRALDLARQGRLPEVGGNLETLDRNRTFARGLQVVFGELAKSFALLAR